MRIVNIFFRVPNYKSCIDVMAAAILRLER